MRQWTIKSFLQDFGNDYSLIGQEEIKINNVAPLDKGLSSDLTFCSSDDKEGLESILNSKSGVILCKKTLANSILQTFGNSNRVSRLFVMVDNPRLTFIKIAKLMKENKVIRKGISKHAIIAESAKIGRDCYIGDFTIIGENCLIGDQTVIDSRVVIKNAKVGNNCVIQPGNVIGEEGFAFEREKKDMNLERFPHLGKVIIKDNVEIFANCSIARGSISDTIIEEGTKIDSLCHIAHNVHIGKNTQVTAGTVIGGSTQIGNNCWLGLNSTIKHKIRVGDNVIVGSGSSVIHNVEDKDIVAGVPAKSIKNKITISKDKLFLMGGQYNNNEEEETKLQGHLLSKKHFFVKQWGLTIISLISATPFVSL
jgi:UDP-3-O-[3-hydroxymyristoyl] glucosamine N-acyltransferase